MIWKNRFVWIYRNGFDQYQYTPNILILFFLVSFSRESLGKFHIHTGIQTKIRNKDPKSPNSDESTEVFFEGSQSAVIATSAVVITGDIRKHCSVRRFQIVSHKIFNSSDRSVQNH